MPNKQDLKNKNFLNYIFTFKHLLQIIFLLGENNRKPWLTMAPAVRKCMIWHNMKPWAGADGGGAGRRGSSAPYADFPDPCLRVSAAPPACSRVAAAVSSYESRGGRGTRFSFWGGLWKSLSEAPQWTFTHISLDNAAGACPSLGQSLAGRMGLPIGFFTNCPPEWNECWEGFHHTDRYVT